MKTELLIGSVCTELSVLVRHLPRGNEDIEAIRTEQHTGGTGFHLAAAFAAFDFPYFLTAAAGSGIYGDAAKEEAGSMNIRLQAQTDELAGCTYSMRDLQSHAMRFAVPGSEYDFYREVLDEVDIDEIGEAAVGGEMLCGDDAEEIIEVLQELEKPILFIGAGYSGEIEERILSALFAMSPAVILTDEEASIMLAQDVSELDACAVRLAKMCGNTVILLQKGTGAVCFDRGESFIAESAEELQPELFGAGFAAARAAGIDLKNSVVFAREYAENGRFSKEMTDMYKRRLAGMILQK